MEPHQNQPSFLSLQHLIEELCDLISMEFSKNSNPWIRMSRVRELFGQKYGISLAEAARAYGHGDDFKSLFARNRGFSLYPSQRPQEFYIALRRAVVPNYDPNLTRPVQDQIKRPWKVDGNLVRMLQAEGAEEIGYQNPQKLKATKEVANGGVPEITEYQPLIVPEINSANDLEMALKEIIKSLTINYPGQVTTVATVSKKFRQCYGQPIRSVIRSVCPDLRLVDLLESIPHLDIKKVDDDWLLTWKEG